MKIYRLSIICAFILGVIAFGCKPENVKPGDHGEIGAYAADSDHIDFRPACGTPLQVPLVCYNYLGTGQNVTLGTLTAGNDAAQTGFVFNSNSFVFSEAAVWTGSGEDWDAYPMDENGIMTSGSFTKYVQLNPVLPEYRINVPLTDNQQTLNAAAWAHILFMQIDPTTGNITPTIDETVWAQQNATAGAQTFTYTNSVGGCPGYCEEWVGAANPCVDQASAPPVCSVPRGIGPGDDLSEYECVGNGNNNNNNHDKVIVCHIPPGNTGNPQQICVDKSALDAHIIDFKPANDPTMGHDSGCHLGPCDPCGPGSTEADILGS